MLPEHVAIIMDGNGRWARARSLPRVMGHHSGVKAADAITKAAAGLGIKALTLYTFSTENWKRQPDEINSLLKLLEQNLDERVGELDKNNIRFRVIGRLDRFPLSLSEKLKKAVSSTARNTGMILTLALDYGSRHEILEAVKNIAQKAVKGEINASAMSEDDFSKFLYTADLPYPDLVIRTSGQMRLSNFLLWQSAYAELYVTNTLWPDFNKAELEKALDEYSRRVRRFGG